MKRLVIMLALILLLATMAACAPQSSGDGEGDGLHSVVPSVIGLDETAARDALDEAGYVVGEVSVDLTSDAEAGTVVEQDPIASTSLPRDGEVDIVVAGP